MSIRQQIIAENIDVLEKKFRISHDEAFVRYAQSLVLGKSTTSFDPEDIVDGGQDKQIDTVSIEEDGNGADVYISQITTSSSFSSNKLVRLAAGLKWVFEASTKDYEKITNNLLKDKIRQFREVRLEHGTSNLYIHVRYIAYGSTKQISKEFKQELERIRDEYDNDTFGSFSIDTLGVDELTDLSKSWERRERSIDTNVKIKYDVNSESLIRYDSEGLKGMVCSVPANEIARLVNENPNGAIFDLNIRQFLGSRGKINRDILQTATSVESHKFWFLNNGITVVCDSFDAIKDPDKPIIKIKNMQIVNGCQTATTLAAAKKEGKLKRGIYVITRIYETNDQNLVNKIVLTTNSQNQISSRNLRANDPTQIDMEKAFEINGYMYERKPRQFENKQVDVEKIFDNEFVGQSYMAIVLKNPSDAQ